jgi:hypothetical protein
VEYTLSLLLVTEEILELLEEVTFVASIVLFVTFALAEAMLRGNNTSSYLAVGRYSKSQWLPLHSF